MQAMVLAVAAAGVVGTLSDWLFMGVLFHGAYNTYPEIWRARAEQKTAILWANALGLVMSAAVIALCALAGIETIGAALGVAVVAWCAGPLPVIVINNMFVKIDPKITLAHCLGYLVRMLIAGLAAGIAIPLS